MLMVWALLAEPTGDARDTGDRGDEVLRAASTDHRPCVIVDHLVNEVCLFLGAQHLGHAEDVLGGHVRLVQIEIGRRRSNVVAVEHGVQSRGVGFAQRGLLFELNLVRAPACIFGELPDRLLDRRRRPLGALRVGIGQCHVALQDADLADQYRLAVFVGLVKRVALQIAPEPRAESRCGALERTTLRIVAKAIGNALQLLVIGAAVFFDQALAVWALQCVLALQRAVAVGRVERQMVLNFLGLDRGLVHAQRVDLAQVVHEDCGRILPRAGDGAAHVLQLRTRGLLDRCVIDIGGGAFRPDPAPIERGNRRHQYPQL